MALTLNGSANTIGGLAAGGLPDATVKQADLYSDVKLGKMLSTPIVGTTSTAYDFTSTTYTDTDLTASITPSATSSKILVLVSHGTCEKRTNNTGMALRLLRGSTEILKFAGQVGYSANTDIQSSSQSTSYLDSPATTSATTYKTQFKSNSNNALVGLHPDNDFSTIQLLEIKG